MMQPGTWNDIAAYRYKVRGTRRREHGLRVRVMDVLLLTVAEGVIEHGVRTLRSRIETLEKKETIDGFQRLNARIGLSCRRIHLLRCP